MPLADYDYALPAERIAQVPLEPRDSSRMLHVAPGGSLQDMRFRDLPDLLRPGDLLVANDTTVRCARLLGVRDDGGEAEVLLLQRTAPGRFTALVRPGRRLRGGSRVRVGERVVVTVLGPAVGHPGAREVQVDGDGDDVESTIAAVGTMPLPPYIAVPPADPGRYQTVYAAGAPASAAAPTAGLHFTAAVQRALAERAVGWATVQLEVGLGTFAPIAAADVRDHRMHEERCSIPAATAAAIAATHASGGRVVAIGTTVVRTLEALADGAGGVLPGAVTTDLFIVPGHGFAVVDGLLTNFHQPRSSLLVLLAAFIGPRWRTAYEHALSTGYRFLSFGDCMVCWRGEALP